MKNNKLLLIIIFSLIGFVSLQIPLSKIVGSNQNFSAFDLLAPTIGMFIQSIPGFISVLFVKLIDLLLIKKSVDMVSLLRLLPLPLAAFYFGSNSKNKSLIALSCMILFIIHPQGRLAWTYSLYWIIPIFATMYPKRLFLRSLGSTFTAHAVGSVIYLYYFNLPAKTWLNLIPVVAMERLQFAVGIYLSFIILNSLVLVLEKQFKWKMLRGLVNSF